MPSARAALLRHIVRIVTKEGQTVPMVNNRVQQRLDDTPGSKKLVLKARQMGITTKVLANYFVDSVLPNLDGSPPNLTTAVVSYNDDHTQLLLAKVRGFYDNMPPPRPVIEHNSAHMMSFPTLGSKIYIGTAGAKVFGLGDTLHRVHLSEYAYWPDDKAREIREGIEQAVPVGGGEIVIENTCNGEGGEFFELWNDENSPYTKVFIPWFEHEEYALPEGSRFALEGDRGNFQLTEEEVLTQLRYGLSMEQMRWRRLKIAECKEKFPQWYPEDEVSCFLLAGGSVFSTSVLNYLTKQCRQAPVIEEGGGLNIWGLPRPQERYIIGVDCADPIEGDDRGDAHAAVVLNTHYEHKATLHGRWSIREFTDKVGMLGRRYNDAFINVERNMSGVGVLELLDVVHRYPFLYKTGTKLGYLTLKPSKVALVSAIRDALDSLALYTYDLDLVKELRAFRKDKDRYGAKAGSHDDLVIALGLALRGMEQAPTTAQPVMTGARSTGYGWSERD